MNVFRDPLKAQALEVRLVLASETSARTAEPSIDDPQPCQVPPATITLAWTAASFAVVKGIVHTPSAKPEMKPASRDALLTVIVKARGWIDAIRLGRIASFAEISQREGQGERHIRLLALFPGLKAAKSLGNMALLGRMIADERLARP
jgi:hypothetical protein